MQLQVSAAVPPLPSYWSEGIVGQPTADALVGSDSGVSIFSFVTITYQAIDIHCLGPQNISSILSATRPSWTAVGFIMEGDRVATREANIYPQQGSLAVYCRPQTVVSKA